jgi:hypothetical protein
MNKKLAQQMNEEFAKALAEFKPEPVVDNRYKIYYDLKSGKIIDVTTLTRDVGEHIEVDSVTAIAVSVIPNEYRVKEGVLYRATMQEMNAKQLDKLENGKFKTIKDDMLFLDTDGEDSYE